MVAVVTALAAAAAAAVAEEEEEAAAAHLAQHGEGGGELAKRDGAAAAHVDRREEHPYAALVHGLAQARRHHLGRNPKGGSAADSWRRQQWSGGPRRETGPASGVGASGGEGEVSSGGRGVPDEP